MPESIEVAGYVPSDAVTGEVVDEGPVGLPIAVDAVRRDDGGLMVHLSIEPEHPAYAAIQASVLDDLAVSVNPQADDGDLFIRNVRTGAVVFPPAVDEVRIDASRVQGVLGALADNAPYVKSRPEVQVSGVSKAEIVRRRPVPPPSPVSLGSAVAALFGAELTGKADQPVREVTRIVPNRAERRRAARRRA